MDKQIFPYRIFPLGDSAVTVEYGNCIDETINKEVIARFNQLQQDPLPGMIEIVPAYSSFTVFYDLKNLKNKIQSDKTVFDWMHQQLEERLQQMVQQNQTELRQINIPVCYEKEFAMDIEKLAATNKISVDEVIQIHTSRAYKVYMLGFLPGFAYMGEVDKKISLPRKPQPVNIKAGSVGIAGKQTGIYPMSSPGGWNIIGRTPVKLFKATPNLPPFVGEALNSENFNISLNETTLLKAGDIVQFYAINKNEFEKILTQNH